MSYYQGLVDHLVKRGQIDPKLAPKVLDNLIKQAAIPHSIGNRIMRNIVTARKGVRKVTNPIKETAKKVSDKVEANPYLRAGRDGLAAGTVASAPFFALDAALAQPIADVAKSASSQVVRDHVEQAKYEPEVKTMPGTTYPAPNMRPPMSFPDKMKHYGVRGAKAVGRGGIYMGGLALGSIALQKLVDKYKAGRGLQ